MQLDGIQGRLPCPLVALPADVGQHSHQPYLLVHLLMHGLQMLFYSLQPFAHSVAEEGSASSCGDGEGQALQVADSREVMVYEGAEELLAREEQDPNCGEYQY